MKKFVLDTMTRVLEIRQEVAMMAGGGEELSRVDAIATALLEDECTPEEALTEASRILDSMRNCHGES